MTSLNPGAQLLIIASDTQLANDLKSSLETIVGSTILVSIADNVDQADAIATSAAADGRLVPALFVEHDESGVGTLLTAHSKPSLRHTRNVLVSREPTLHGVDRALSQGAVNGMITHPWTELSLRKQLAAQIATAVMGSAPERLREFDFLLDESDRTLASERLRQARQAPDAHSGRYSLLLDPQITSEEVETLLQESIDVALGHPPRLRVSPGTVMIEQGDNVGGFYLILDGVVQLSSKRSGAERVMHERSTGSIVGLLSLAEHRNALLRCKAVTEVRAIPITLDQLGRALARDPGISQILTKVLVDSLARRLRRSSELQAELDQSLLALSEARAGLVSAAKFSTLGEMSAGIAHELNNPAAALIRSLDHIGQDLPGLVSDQATRRLLSFGESPAGLSTAEIRSLRRKFTAKLGDSSLASQVIDSGITDLETALSIGDADPTSRERMLSAARLGNALDNAKHAADRVHSLVDSLSAYSRGADGRGPMVEGIGVVEGMDRALRLLHHRLGNITLERTTEPVPTVTARPGALQQVWTNLIANAADAMNGEGTLSIRVVRASAGIIRVEVGDNGPGMSEKTLARIFEPRFTTKDGQVRFGLGLGLTITRQIIDEHGGTISVRSKPGETVFTIDILIGESHE